MALTISETQVEWSTSDSVSVTSGSNQTSDEVSVTQTSIARELKVKADNAGTPASGDTIEIKILINAGDVDADPECVLMEVVEALYRPRSAAVRDDLGQIFWRAEQAYFDSWSPLPAPPTHPPGELHIAPLLGTTPGGAAYLTNLWGWPVMVAPGRAAYKQELIAILRGITSLEGICADEGRLGRIMTCINNVIADIDIIEVADSAA